MAYASSMRVATGGLFLALTLGSGWHCGVPLQLGAQHRCAHVSMLAENSPRTPTFCVQAGEQLQVEIDVSDDDEAPDLVWACLLYTSPSPRDS